MDIGVSDNYVMVKTVSTWDEDHNQVFDIRHSTVQVTDSAEVAPGRYRAGEMIAIWVRKAGESSHAFGERAMYLTPDRVAVVDAYGDLLQLDDRYRDMVAL